MRLPPTYKYRIFSLLFATFLLGGCVDENALSSNTANNTDAPIGVVIPGDDTPPVTEPAPAPVEPAPAPVEPAPAPVEPAPAPVEPAPTPVEPDITNTAPSINGVPDETITEGFFYIFTPEASDPDGDDLIFSIRNLPQWANFDTVTGAIYGTPTVTDIGLYENIMISVSDGQATATLSSISIDVVEALPAVPENTLFNEIVGYSIFIGTSRDALTLQTTLDVGSSVSYSTDLAAANTYHFSIVAHDANGNNIFLSNSELSGYRIYAGTSSDSLLPAFELVSGPNDVFQISGLYEGTFYLSVTAYDTSGNEGPLSNIAQILLM